MQRSFISLAWIDFDPNLGFWSPFTFWVLIISVILTIGFTVAIFIGGIGDLRYLIRSLDEELPPTERRD